MENENIHSFSPQTPFWYTASDVMRLQGYITLHVGKKASDIPLIVMPYDGPFQRTTSELDMTAQCLVNRGYGVFQPNFRGSKGLGRAYIESADKDFDDGIVHQDIMDGVDYLLQITLATVNNWRLLVILFGGLVH